MADNLRQLLEDAEEDMKDYPGYEGLYAATRDGKVWSYKSGRFLTPSNNGKGYLKVNLNKDGKSTQKLVHRIIAETFIPNPENKPQVNHIDEDKTNNKVSNLCWMTAKENTNYGTGRQRQTNSRKKRVWCVELEKEFESITQAADELGLWKSHVSKCCHGQINSTGGYHFEFMDKDTIYRTTQRPILCIETQEVYPTSKAVLEAHGISKWTLWDCLNGRLQTAAGYHWRYIEPEAAES